ncbi:MAG: hypothetical protein MI921_15535 [Cytophagales bacterium]|nr:hypothetical protein [Cytophagales bacterium]
MADSLTISPESVNFPHFNDSLIHYQYDMNTGLIEIATTPGIDSLLVCFRVFPFNLGKTYFKRSLAVYDSNAFFKEQRKTGSGLVNRREELFSSPGLQKSGSISRGISFGNNQNVFVNSSLNLQLEGRLSDDINIRAVISDQNVPFQPQGNTQQLQEFDNVFVQLYNSKGSLTVGDVVFRNQPSQFMRYYRNVQGGLLDLNYKINDRHESSTQVGAAVAKGKFASYRIRVNEGVLGPYQVRGPNNERFIIIMANSERVYLDGKLLKRGFNYDYVIDYNLAEITFTNKVLITKFSRVRVDFEFADRNYSRTVFNASHRQSLGNLDFFIHTYSEKDNPNRSLTFDLTNEEKQRFSEAGDRVPLAIADPGDSVAFNENIILYKRVDTTTLDNQTFTIFKFSAHPDSAFYNVSFTETGSGEGNYIQQTTTANGRVFAWVAPLNGVPQGNFEPVRVLPAPTKKQLVTIGSSYKINKVGKIYGEIAFSDQDLNLFSELDTDDDHGYAVKFGYESESKPVGFLDGYKWQTVIDYEIDDKNFVPLDRFRYIEFDRDWSYNPEEEEAVFDDHIFNFSTQLARDDLNRLNYQLTNRRRGNQVDGFQHKAVFAKELGKLQLSSDFFLMHNDQRELRSDWSRFNLDLHWNSRFLVPGYTYASDRNEVKNINTDALISSAMNFEEHKLYLRSNDTLKSNFVIDYSIREDKSPHLGLLEKSNHAETANLGFNGSMGKNHQLNTLVTYRTIDNFLVEEQAPKREETIMGRLDWRGRFFDRVINTNLTYAIGNGRELRREFAFLPVPTGEGTHTWRDDNNDGIQDLNEFFEAINTDERNFIKVLQPTNEFIQAYTNNFIFRMDVKLPVSWNSQPGFKKFLYRFSNNTSINMLKKFTDDDLTTRLASFLSDIPENQLISTRESIRSTLFFNRSQPRYGFDLTYFMNRRKQLLTGGFEDTEDRSVNLNTRINLKRNWDFRIQVKQAQKSNDSDFLMERNFLITEQSVSPLISLQPRNNLRVSGGYTMTHRKNTLLTDLEEFADVNEFNFDMRLSKVNKSNLGINFRLIEIQFEGNENSASGYELLQALRPGTNLTWLINWQQKIAGGLQLSVNYEGRKSPDRGVVHMGRMQVRALF